MCFPRIDSLVQAVSLHFRDDVVDLRLADGRRVMLPLSFYPTLRRMTPRQRRRWEFIGPGEGFHWEEFDLQLSAEDMAAGLREYIPPPGWRDEMEADLKRRGLTNRPRPLRSKHEA